MRRLTSDTAAVAGERWEGMRLATVGAVAEQAIEGLRTRLSGGGEAEGNQGEGGTEGGGSE